MTGYDKVRDFLKSKAGDDGIFRKVKSTGDCIVSFSKDFVKIKHYCNQCSARACNKCIKENLDKEYN